MKRTDYNDSFTMLKDKFDEIKRNINRIQSKQSDLIRNSPSPQYEYRSPMIPDRAPKDPSVSSYIRMIKSLEVEKDLLQQSVVQLKAERDNLMHENQKLQKGSVNQQLMLEKITKENEELKKRLLDQKRSSCLKGEFSTPKKHRVAFSKDLTEVVHIKEDDCPSSVNASKRRSSDYTQPTHDMGFSRYAPVRRNQWFKDFYN